MFSFAGLLNLSTSDAEFCTNILIIISSSIFLNRLVELSKFSKYSYRSIAELKMSSGVSILLFLGIGLELISIGFRSLSLGFRFLANLSAGHVLSDIAFSFRFSTSFSCFYISFKIHLIWLRIRSASYSTFGSVGSSVCLRRYFITQKLTSIYKLLLVLFSFRFEFPGKLVR